MEIEDPMFIEKMLTRLNKKASSAQATPLPENSPGANLRVSPVEVKAQGCTKKSACRQAVSGFIRLRLKKPATQLMLLPSWHI